MNYAFTKFGMVVRSSDDATIPIDPNNSDYQAVLAWVAEGKVVTPYVEPFDIESAVIQAVQQRLDDFARTRGYDDIKSAASFHGDEDPQFNLEGTYCQKMRSRYWRLCYTALAQITAGQRAMPASVEEAVSELPPLVWPQL